jgi:hypothetical protein
MNWQAGILAVLLFYVPVIIVAVLLYKKDKEFNRKYEERMKEFRTHWLDK